MSTRRIPLAFVGALVAACGPTPAEPPNLPAPEYEEPRAYDPDKAIDTAGGGEEDVVPDAPPPPDPVEAPPDAEIPAVPEPAEGAGGAAAEGEPES